MGPAGFRLPCRWPVRTTAAIVFGLCATLRASTDTPPDSNRELHEAAHAYYLAVQASVNDLDRARMLLRDAAGRLPFITGDSTMTTIVGQLSMHVRNTASVLEQRHQRLVDLSRDVRGTLDRHDPHTALAQLATIPLCLPGGAPASPTEVSNRDCQPASDAHFDLDGLHRRAHEDIDAADALVRQGDALAHQCADPRGALAAYREARLHDAARALDDRIATARACEPGLR